MLSGWLESLGLLVWGIWGLVWGGCGFGFGLWVLLLGFGFFGGVFFVLLGCLVFCFEFDRNFLK